MLVTAEGRVVVLDFGLAIDPDAGGVGQTVADAGVSGTPGYMAPEQAAGQAATTASDFYALGVMLFEALTGKLPFEGSAAEMLVDKQRAAAPRASSLVPAAPPDLDELCAQLLSREPSARPDAAALRALLPPPKERSASSGSYASFARSGSDGRGGSIAPEAAPELLGRQAELAALRDAFDATLPGKAEVVFVRGESGMGKSALCEASGALRISPKLDDANLGAGIEDAAGATWINCGQWQRGRAHLTRALEVLREQANPNQSLLDSTHFYSHQAAFHSGDWLYVAAGTPKLIEYSYGRDRIWIAVILTWPGSAAWLSGNDIAGYERVLQRAKSRWQPRVEAQWPDFAITFGEAMYNLYRGQAEQALAVIDQTRAWFARSLLSRAQLADAVALHNRGLATLAVLRATGDRALTSVVRDCEKGLARLELPLAKPMRSTLAAGLALHAGNVDLATTHLGAAATGFDTCDMVMYAAAARRRLGELIGGDEGKALLAQGDATMRAQRIVNLDAITEMLCAGCRAP